MPAVDVAMERSLRRGFLDLVVASLRPALGKRDIAGQISDVRTAFSSWDNCMQVNYCKWPVIAVIVIGGLIIFSVIWCIIRCACCGLSCCCSCFHCLRCCGNCCGCCDPPRGRHKYLDEPYIPPQHGYKSQEPMHAGFSNGPAASKGPAFAQFAEFDASGKKNEDALPQMPSWDGAEQKKVLVEEEAVEMNALKKPEVGGQAARSMSPHGSRSPINRSPYGPPTAGPGSGGYYAANAVDRDDPYAQDAPAYSQPGGVYGEAEHGYGAAGFAMGHGRQSPQVFNNAGYDGYNNINNYGQAHDYSNPGRQGNYDSYGSPRQQPYDNYDNFAAPANQGYGIARYQTPSRELNNASPFPADARRSPAPPQSPYGPESRRSPAPRAPYGSEARRSPAPQGDYGSRRSPAPRQGPYSGARSPAQRQYSNDMHSPIGGSGSNGPTPLRNEAGFDFTSGYSRPPAARSATASPVNGGGGGYRQPSPAADLGDGSGYPGYQPYKPA